MKEEASTSLISGRTPGHAGLRALKEQKEKEEEEGKRVREATWQPQEQQQQQQHQPEEQQQTLEGQQQQQQQGAQEEGPLEPPPQGLAQPVPPAPQEPGEQEEDLSVYGPPTPTWLLPGAPAAIRAEPG